MSKIEKGQDYWYIQLIGKKAEIKANTNDYPKDYEQEWNMFPSRVEAERALAKVILLLTEPEEPNAN